MRSGLGDQVECTVRRFAVCADRSPDIYMLREYDTWDNSSLTLSRPTHLYNLAPIGIGTPMVESLTGYLVRLAEAHCVSAGVLYWKEIRPLAGKGNIFTFRLTTDEGYSTHTINGLGSPAVDFVHALEMLTGRRDLRSLTMLAWANVLPRSSLLRRSRAWCECCLYAWREAEQPIYEPLLWALRGVTVCPDHQRPLRLLCQHCQRLIGPLDSRSRSGYCSRCGQSLVPTAVALKPAAATALLNDELVWATWVASALGDLLAAGPQILCPQTREHLAQTIRLCIDRAASGNASAFARLLHVGRGDVNRWRKGKALPRLDVLLNIAYRLGTFLPDFLSGCPASVPIEGFVRSAPVAPSSNAHRPAARCRTRINSSETSRILHTALTESPPPSVTEVMKRLRHSEVTVRRHFPQLCSEIAKHYAEYRVKRAITRKTQAADEVRRIAYELHANGIALRRRNMRPLLTSSDYLNLEEGRAALRQVRRELGL
jgi:hypothetical protein